MIDLHAFHRSCAGLSIATVLALLAVPSFAQGNTPAEAMPSSGPALPSSASIASRFPAGSIRSELLADQALAAAQKERAGIEARYVAEQRACYERFFVTSCMEAVRERHHAALEQVRPIEIEAEKFKRQQRVAERDKALAEKRAQEAAEAPERAERQRENERANAEKAAERTQQAAEAQASEKEHAANTARRTAENQERLQRANAEAAGDAQKRAENTAAYEKKVRDAQEHQKDVEANKKAKEQARKNNPAP
jgi:colicin import membrane protein